ncbi:Uncharacterised protein [Legionella pneumophila]|nr:Uncharacterised protein [Legionella pneumophila]
MDLANASKPIPTANKVPAKVQPASIARPTPGTPKATDNTTATADVMGDAIKSGTGSKLPLENIEPNTNPVKKLL